MYQLNEKIYVRTSKDIPPGSAKAGPCTYKGSSIRYRVGWTIAMFIAVVSFTVMLPFICVLMIFNSDAGVSVWNKTGKAMDKVVEALTSNARGPMWYYQTRPEDK